MKALAPNALDTAIYVGLACIVAAQAVHIWDWRAGLGIVGAGLTAWKAKRSIGTADAKAGDDPETQGP